MAVKFGVLVPQGWKFDLEDVEGAEAQFEAMVRTQAQDDSLPQLRHSRARGNDGLAVPCSR